MRNLLIIILILITLFAAYWFWVREEPVQYKTIAVPMLASTSSIYVRVKEEMNDWLEIIGKMVPILSFIFVFVMKKKKG